MSDFNYLKAADLEEAAVKQKSASEGEYLAGGMTLLPAIKLGLNQPSDLVDLAGIADLQGVRVEGGNVVVGAMTRHADVAASGDVQAQIPALADLASGIGDPQVRNRGTLGGSIAFAEPAAEVPACVLALNGEIEIAGPDGRRKVAAGDFFKGLYDTDLGSGEIITAVEFAADSDDWRTGFDELARRHGDYAMAGLAARLRIDGETVAEARLAYFAVGDKPVLGLGAGAEITGKKLSPEAIEAAAAALDGDLEPFDDLHSSAAMKQHLAGELTRRVLGEMVGGAS